MTNVDIQAFLETLAASDMEYAKFYRYARDGARTLLGQTMISLSECKHGYLYKLNSRNLAYGVFHVEKKGFIGIRTKFGNRFLDTEYHWETGPPFGTAQPQEELERIPGDLVVEERSGVSFDRITNRPVAFERREAGGSGRWYFADDFSTSDSIRPQSCLNEKLFDYLDRVKFGQTSVPQPDYNVP